MPAYQSAKRLLSVLSEPFSILHQLQGNLLGKISFLIMKTVIAQHNHRHSCPEVKKKEHEPMLFPVVRYRVSRYYTCCKFLMLHENEFYFIFHSATTYTALQSKVSNDTEMA